ncbi:MAG TPA: SAM-dependent methyltransferase [Longimicrobium sp.]|nr:SAM-dependent methyltransferase [Longimicrobium sp.]
MAQAVPGKIENVSDTARWVAIYRAMESERPDALFTDPWARRLGGERGEAIVRAMPRGRSMAWPMIVRTAVFDRVILESIRTRGVDLVLNLAAGLDTRAWRLDLPPGLRWVDVDLPGITEYKAGVMAGETPRCRYEAVSADLSDAVQRDGVFGRVARESRCALVVAEGLLVYLPEADVAALARSLHAQPAFRWWLADLASPRLMDWMQKRWGKTVSAGNAPFRFAPGEGTGFFAPLGWREAEVYGTIQEALRLKRAMRGAWIYRLALRVAPERKREEMRRFSMYVLLERT